MSRPVANSTNQITLTLTQGGTRVVDATVLATITAPDGITNTVVDAPVPHISNGVYTVKLGGSAWPKKGNDYLAEFEITHGSDVIRPKYYFDVFEH